MSPRAATGALSLHRGARHLRTVTVDASNFTGSGVLVGYNVSSTLVGSNRAVDSNANPSGTTPGTLPGGGSDQTIDFGFYKPITVSLTTTPSQTSTNGKVVSGQFATIGFWHNQNGQAVINSFNGGPTQTALGTWLANSFPSLFGSSNPYIAASLAQFGKTSLAGMTNAQVATVYANLWTPSGLVKNTYVQAFAVALGLYADTSALGGASLVSNGLAAQNGFVVTASGAGTFNVGNDGAAFSVTNGTSVSVASVMSTVNSSFSPSTGLFYTGDQGKTSGANDVLNGINSVGDIPGNASNLGGSGIILMDSATLSGGHEPDGDDHVLPDASAGVHVGHAAQQRRLY